MNPYQAVANIFLELGAKRTHFSPKEIALLARSLSSGKSTMHQVRRFIQERIEGSQRDRINIENNVYTKAFSDRLDLLELHRMNGADLILEK